MEKLDLFAIRDEKTVLNNRKKALAMRLIMQRHAPKAFYN